MKASAGHFLRSPTPEQEGRICEHVFDSPFCELDETMRSEYIEYIHSEIATMRDGVSHGIVDGGSLAIATLEELEVIIQELRQSFSLPLRGIRDSLKQRLGLPPSSSPDQAIFLAMRLLYMLNVQTAKLRSLTPKTRVLPWDEETTLHEFVNGHFPKTDLDMTLREGRLHPYFTAVNMHRICNLKIQWTDSLEDHLRLDRRSCMLRVFPHKRCLLQMLKGYQSKEKYVKSYPSPYQSCI
jgi:hypothetical protein